MSLKFQPYTAAFIADEVILNELVKLKYCSEFPEGRRWFYFNEDTKLWVNCVKNEHENSIKKVLKSYSHAASNGNGIENKTPKQHDAISEKMGSSKMIIEVLHFMRSHPDVAVLASDWDSNPMELSTPSEIIDLRTMKRRRRSEKDLNLKVTSCNVETGVPESFLHFLLGTQLQNATNVRFIQQICGYFLTGVTTLQLFFILYGDGGNGKGTLFDVIDHILGGGNTDSSSSYSRKVNAKMFIKGGGDNRFDLSTLQGKRFVYVTEVPVNCTLDKEKVNSLTGSDKVSTEFKGGHSFDYQPNFKCVMSVNNKPIIESVDNSIVRRLRLIPFTVDISDENKDPHLSEKLKRESGKILYWFLMGLRDLIANKWVLSTPKEIADATNDYLDDEDFFGAWFKDNVTRTKDIKEMDLSSGFYNSYTNHCNKNGVPVINHIAFSKLMLKKCKKKSRNREGVIFDGYCLIGEEKIRILNLNDIDSFNIKRYRTYQ